MNRRRFLTLASLAGLTACSARQTVTTAPPTGAARPTPISPAPTGFPQAVNVPPILQPARDAAGVRHFELIAQTGRTQIVPGTQTPTWGYNGSFLGPTLRAARGDTIAMTVRNQLPETTTVHWHGMALPAAADGGPHQPIAAGATWSPQWTIIQPATTNWYHPHPHGQTATHVYRGLAGLFIIDDEAEPELPSNYGVDDVPLIIQDKFFAEDGSFSGDPHGGDDGILGDTILVNGTYRPHLRVTSERVRLRILNGSNARVYHLGFADNRTFQVIGTDSGLLAAPVEVERVTISPAERLQIVVPLTAGEQVLLRTTEGEDDLGEDDFDILLLVAAAQLKPSPPVPGRLAGLQPVRVPGNAVVRRFDLDDRRLINGLAMDPTRIDLVIPASATEIWEITNSDADHNFHIHEVAFQILDINGRPPPAYLAGRKDTVYLPEDSIARLAVPFGTFTDPASPYMYHCHILRHEDDGMMGQFVIVQPGTETRTPRTLPPIHTGHGG
ncbi:multicopper oxidase family protein [Nonomuraea sp. NPDC059194]|uniref:multicopper oxidase family protein n=1 Tax=Nonomuraea sp. NPDC059194 TaxID=3346764 RepID=UPI0036ABA87A